LVRSENPPLTRFSSHLRDDTLGILRAAVNAVGAEHLVARALADRRDLRAIAARDDLIVIAAGKAAGAMLRGFAAADLRAARGLVTTTHLRDELPPNVEGFLAGHPVPNPQSAAAGARALQLARTVPAGGRLVVLLSGGASALLAAPAPGLALEDKMAATRALLSAGAAIHDLNAVRKHLSAVKGGRLAAAAARAGCDTFAISDVVGPVEADPSVIGSGPTVADASTFADALDALDRLGVIDTVPASARRVLEEGRAGERPETPKPGDAKLAHSQFSLIGSRHDAMAGARREAERLGYTVAVLDEPIVGEARIAAPDYVARVRGLANRLPRPCCVISSGETTVRVTGTGKGGRNQEFALAMAQALAADERSAMGASIGTDGIDGPTDAAGAIVDTLTLERARRAGLAAPEAFFANNDAYHFFDAIGDLVRTGPTDTNVGDLQVLLVDR
jgi:hydroxypyruvate reductase